MVEVVVAFVAAVLWHPRLEFQEARFEEEFGRGFTLGPSFGKIVGDFVSEDSLMPRNPDKGERCGKFEEVESFEEIFGKFLVASGFPAAFGDVDGGCR